MTNNYIEFYFFYTLCSLTILSSFIIIFVSNPIYCILFLIITFCSICSLLIFIEAEFIALILIVIYVGAIAVLFLFIVIILNLKIQKFNKNFSSSFHIFSYIGFIFGFVLIETIISGHSKLNFRLPNDYLTWINVVNSNHNINNIGYIIYTYYSDLFQICGLILLVAIVSSIIITIKEKNNFNKQDNQIQILTNYSNRLIYSNNSIPIFLKKI